MRNTFLFLATVALLPAAFAQDAPKQPLPSDAMDVVFLGAKQPVLIRLNVLIDGRPIQTYFNEHVDKWFQYLDVDKDGLLDADELKRAPSAQGWLQMMQQGGTFFPNVNNVLSMAQFGRKPEEKVTPPELQAYYRRASNPLQLVPQANNAGIFGQASDTLFKTLDLNKDGKLSKEELQHAVKALRKFDLDDDELITAQELAVTNPVAGGGFGFQLNQRGGFPPPGVQVSDSFFHIKPGENRLPILLLALYDKDKSQTLSREEVGLDEATFAKLDADRDGRLDLNELAHWHERAADLEFTISLGKDAGVKLHDPAQGFAAAVKESARGVYQMSLEDAQINLVSSQPGGFMIARPNQAQVYMQQFRNADTKGQGFLELADLVGQQYQFLRQVFPYLDRDSDGKLTEKEVKLFVDLQSQSTDWSVIVSLADQGRVLFHVLDTNRDGRLSQRELQNAWNRLAPLDKNKTGMIAMTDLTRQFQFTVQRGQGNNFIAFQPGFGGGFNPPVVAANYPKDTPAWFRKMDKNGDGDVSPAEFLGSREEFDRIDSDRDGLISAEEAIRYDAMMRAKK